MKLTIKKKKIDAKWGFQQLILFEKLMKRPYLGSSLEDHVVYLYCAIVVALKSELSYDDFFAYIDKNPDVVENWLKYLNEQFEEEKK